MANDILVQLEFTPNPDTLKYSTNRSLLARGSKNILSPEQAKEQSPLAEKLFEFDPVSAVMIGTNFVTLTLKDQDSLNELNDKFISVISEFIRSGSAAVKTEFLETEASDSSNLGGIEKKIVDILDKEVRPAVAMDGGDITFEKFEDGFVYLKMQGACSGCPSSLMTLKMGVESRLKDAIPEVQEVIPV